MTDSSDHTGSQTPRESRASLLEWFSDSDLESFAVTVEYFEGAPSDIPLEQILDLDGKDAKPFRSYLLNCDELPSSLSEGLTELRWGIRAYSQFQDILGVTVDRSTPQMFNRHYCYYESLMYLRESAISWLDRNFVAALTLLRPFLELALLHCYWNLLCEMKGYKRYYDWLEAKRG